MKIFYYCYGSAHSSVTAANIHLGNLPMAGRARFTEIVHQPLFDRTEDYGLGLPYYMGTDDSGRDIYVIGLAGGKRVLARALAEFLALAHIGRESVRFEDALQHAGVLMRIGGYLSRRLGFILVGRPLAASGVWLKYGRFAHHVGRVKAALADGRPED